MSRIGRKPVTVPAGVKVSINGQTVNVEGPVGKLSHTVHPSVSVKWDEKEKHLVFSLDESAEGADENKKHWGSARAHVSNMIEGVTKGYEKALEVVGVGWTASVSGKNLTLVVGFANKIVMEIPAGLKVTVDKQIVKVGGCDKALVGRFAADMRANRKPEPYNGKGIKYTDEVIRRKQGKQFGA